MTTKKKAKAAEPEVPPPPPKKPKKSPPTIFDPSFPIDKIRTTHPNIRSTLGDLSSLVNSVKGDGIIEPLVVIPVCNDEDGEWTGFVELVAGARRLNAAKKAEMLTVPVRSMSLDEKGQLRIKLIENLQREDMLAYDIGTAIRALMDMEEMNQKEVAEHLSVSEAYVSNHVALLKLPEKAVKALKTEKITFAHARVLTRLKDDDQILAALKDAPSMTAMELDNKVDFMLQKGKSDERQARADEAARLSQEGSKGSKSSPTPGKKTRAKTTEADHEEADQKPSLAETYASAKVAPLNKTDMKDKLTFYANKYDRAESETKKMEYKYVLKGLEIAAGITK